MLDRQERRPTMASGSYWSAVINPALMSYNDFQNFIFYQRNLAAMQQFHQHQQELFRQHYTNRFLDKKRSSQQRSDSESPKPKRIKLSEASHSGKWHSLQRPATGAAAVVLDSPEELRAETTTPNSNRSGLITFRPHSDILTSCLGTSGGCSKGQLHRKKSDGGELKKIDTSSTSGASSAASNMSNVSDMTAEAETYEEGEGPISRIFPEILSIIFQYLDLTSKGRAAQVCSVWRDAVYRKSVWKGVEARLHLKRSNPTLFPSLMKRGIKRVQVLSLRRSLRELINGMPNLESLNLTGCYNLSESAIEGAFTKQVPKLKELNVSLCKEVTDNCIGRIATNCRNLEVLDLGGCSKITNNGVILIAWGMKNLKKLNLRSCRQITDYGIANLCGSVDTPKLGDGAKNLENLCLQDCQKLTDKSLKYISSGLTRLEKLNLSFCVSITDTGLKSLARSSSLRDLNLCSCDNVSDIGVGFLARTNDFLETAESPTSKLERLDVSFCSNITDSGMKHLATGLTTLKNLSVANCSLTDESLTRIARCLTRLETLNIGQCNKVSDSSLSEIAKNLKNLIQIDLYGCSKVTDKAIKELQKMPSLVKINQELWPQN